MIRQNFVTRDGRQYSRKQRFQIKEAFDQFIKAAGLGLPPQNITDVDFDSLGRNHETWLYYTHSLGFVLGKDLDDVLFECFKAWAKWQVRLVNVIL